MYNIVMFAYNEAKNIRSSLTSVYKNKGENLNKVYLIANGCSDDTSQIAEKHKNQLEFTQLEIICISLGDKCNAWNYYIHKIANSADCHFFIDADVNFSSNCFELMHNKLMQTDEQTVAIAGMPLTGRNLDFYRSLVKDRSCFFGNLYGLKHSFLERIREDNFYLPIGLNWIDSFLTKAVNTDIQFFNYNLPSKVTYLEGVGYQFESLSPFNLEDIKLYFNRIARYELGKLQEKFLDKLDVKDWPKEMDTINIKIQKNIDVLSNDIPIFKKYLVKKRLQNLLKK